MYSEHQPLIADYALSHPHRTFRTALFVLSTINRHFERVPAVMHAYDTLGITSRYFTRWQRSAIVQLFQDSQRLYLLSHMWAKQEVPVERALHTLVRMPGFGMVKGGFYLQLVCPNSPVGCLDRWHVRRLNVTLPPVPPTIKSPLLMQHITQYVSLCRANGGAARLWDDWCEVLSTKRPKSFPTPESVSKQHVSCIIQ